MTSDESDFLAIAIRWHESGKLHAGIAIAPYQVNPSNSGAVARALRQVAHNYPAELPEGVVIYLSRDEDP